MTKQISMKIAIFTDTYIPELNGVVTSIDNFTRLMADDGNEIMTCLKYGLYRDKKYPNIKVKRFPSVSFANNKEVRVALPSVVAVVDELRAFNPDVIHIQTPMGIGWVGILATKILKRRNIQTYHTYIPDFLVYLKPRTFITSNRLVNQLISSKIMMALLDMELYEGDAKDKNTLKKLLAERAESSAAKMHPGAFTEAFAWNYTRVIYNRADLVLTPSLALKHALKRHRVKSRVEVMSNGIDFDDYEKKTDYGLKNKIIHIGRIGTEKNVEVIIKAFAIALKSRPELKLEIWGDGPAKKGLETLSKELGLTKSIKFIGFYQREATFKILKNYDFFVTASTIETQGLVILEAMAAGLPVLGVDKLAIPEVIKDGQNGYLSRPFDAKGMAENMLKVLENEDRRKRFGQKSLKIAETNQLVKCKDRLFNFYKEIAAK